MQGENKLLQFQWPMSHLSGKDLMCVTPFSELGILIAHRKSPSKPCIVHLPSCIMSLNNFEPEMAIEQTNCQGYPVGMGWSTSRVMSSRWMSVLLSKHLRLVSLKN